MLGSVIFAVCPMVSGLIGAVSAKNRAERIRRIVLLLTHRLDYLDSAQRLAQSFPSKPGAQPTQRVACSCARLCRNSWVGQPDCLLCHGTGFRRRYRGLDGDAVQDERGAIFDPMTYAHDRSVKAGESGGLRVMTRQEVDRELARLRSDENARAGVHSKRERYGWERAREKRDASGSFRELDRALDALSIRHPSLAALVYNVFKGVYGHTKAGEPPRIPAGASKAYWQALLFLEARMPEVIRVPQALTDTDSKQQRQERVVDTYKRTGSIAKTAFAHRMFKGKAKKILQNAGLVA